MPRDSLPAGSVPPPSGPSPAGSASPAPAPAPSATPWPNPDFRLLFAASVTSRLGSQIGYVAVPLFAVTALDAGAGQVGALSALGTAAFLLIGLPPASGWTGCHGSG